MAVQQHDEARQLQHQQGISSSMHNLSQAATTATEENQVQHKPPPSMTIMAKQEPRHPVTIPVNPQRTAPEPIKNPEPILMDEKALLACLVRVVRDANAKISLKATVSFSLIPPICAKLRFLQVQERGLGCATSNEYHSYSLYCAL